MAVSRGNVQTWSIALSRHSEKANREYDKISSILNDNTSGAGPEQDRPLLHFHGRRLGKPLRVNHRKLVNELLPDLRLADPTCPAASFEGPLDGIWLEIGFGGGEHLVAQARANPGIGFIGAEPFINGIAKVLSVIEREKLPNIRLHDDDARPLLDALPDGSIDRIYLLFADPWPKKRHNKRRFVTPENLDRLTRVLKDGAELRFASDHTEYVTWALERLGVHPELEWLARRPADWRMPPADWVPTRYQEKAEARGEVCTFLQFRRRPRQDPKGV